MTFCLAEHCGDIAYFKKHTYDANVLLTQTDSKPPDTCFEEHTARFQVSVRNCLVFFASQV